MSELRASIFVAVAVTAVALLSALVWEFALQQALFNYVFNDSVTDDSRQKWKHVAFIIVIVLLTIAIALPLLHLFMKNDRKLQERLNAAQRVAQIGSWELDLKRNELWWSNEIFRLFELDPNKFGATYEAFLSAIHPDDRDDVDAAYTQSLESKAPYRITHRLLMPDGRIKWVEERCETKFAADGTPELSMGIVQDITKIRETEVALRVSQKQLERSDKMRKLASEQAKVAFWRWSFTENKITDYSENYVGPNGFRARIPTDHAEMLHTIHPDDREKVLTTYTQANLGPPNPDVPPDDYDVEFRLSTPAGKVRWVREYAVVAYDEGGRPEAHYGILQDITDFKLAEAALKVSEERLNEIFEIAPEAIIAVGSNMNIRLFNHGAERIFGYSADEVIGKPLEMLMPERFRSRHKSLVQEFRKSGMEYRLMDARQEIIGLRKDGSEFPAAASVSKSRRQTGTVFTVMLHDTTERRASERARLTALKDAERANAVKSKFMASMSHELRTPLNSILGFAEMISHEYLGPVGQKKYREYALDITFSGTHLLNLVNQILDIERIESEKYELVIEDIELSDLFGECERLLQKKAADQNVQLTMHPPQHTESVQLDRRAIFQVLINLLANAIKFTPPGGRIDVTEKSVDGTIVIEVADTGIGIPAERLANVKEPFSRHNDNPHQTQEGVGLGLAIANALVELHGGTLTLDSEEGAGTKVTIQLPLFPSECPGHIAGASHIPAQNGKVHDAFRISGADKR